MLQMLYWQLLCAVPVQTTLGTLLQRRFVSSLHALVIFFNTAITLITGDKLFLDKRDNTEFDLLTVNETSVEPPQDDGNSLNSPRNLALEATFINHNFSQQVSYQCVQFQIVVIYFCIYFLKGIENWSQ